MFSWFLQVKTTFFISYTTLPVFALNKPLCWLETQNTSLPVCQKIFPRKPWQGASVYSCRRHLMLAYVLLFFFDTFILSHHWECLLMNSGLPVNAESGQIMSVKFHTASVFTVFYQTQCSSQHWHTCERWHLKLTGIMFVVVVIVVVLMSHIFLHIFYSWHRVKAVSHFIHWWWSQPSNHSELLLLERSWSYNESRDTTVFILCCQKEEDFLASLFPAWQTIQQKS